MGAETFSQVATGETAKLAFRSAVESAQWDHGHSGYSGTIAEKDGFIDLTHEADPDTLQSIRRDEYFGEYNSDLFMKVDNKWGPAGCVELKPGRYLFFGWASS